MPNVLINKLKPFVSITLRRFRDRIPIETLEMNTECWSGGIRGGYRSPLLIRSPPLAKRGNYFHGFYDSSSGFTIMYL